MGLDIKSNQNLGCIPNWVKIRVIVQLGLSLGAIFRLGLSLGLMFQLGLSFGLE